MTLQTIPGGLWIPPGWPNTGAGVPLLNQFTALTIANNRVAFVFQVPKTGTLDWFEVRYGNVTNAPDNGMRFSFQDVDSNGNPDNGEDQYAVATMASVATGLWSVLPDYMGSTGTGSGSKRSVTRGDWLACVIRFESFTAGDSVVVTLLTADTLAAPSSMFKYASQSSDAGASYTKQTDRSLDIALKYDDGTYACLGWPDVPMLVINTRTFSNASTPDERGLLFQVPFPCRCEGGWVRVDSDAAWDMILYNAAGSNIASQTYGIKRVSTTGSNGRIYFPTPVDLTENVDYRLVVKPTSASTIAIYDFDINSNVHLEAIDGGVNWMSTSRTDAGAWTDTDTNRPFMGIILSAFDDGASGGGGETSSVF